MKINIKKLPNYHEGLGLPIYTTRGAAGADIKACFNGIGSIEVLDPGESMWIPTGLGIEIPDYCFEIQIRPRSGTTFKKNLVILNSPGTIDSDYRGEIKILMKNIGKEAVRIDHGERIAQLILAPVYRAEFRFVDALTKTERGQGGFGHTGRGL